MSQKRRLRACDEFSGKERRKTWYRAFGLGMLVGSILTVLYALGEVLFE